VLFMEAPRGVGFSYQDQNLNNDTDYNDDKVRKTIASLTVFCFEMHSIGIIPYLLQTALDNFLALKDFFANYPEYQTRDFYVSGESYGGVYVPTLTRKLIQQIQAGNLTANLVGMAVGNGELSEYLQINSAVDLLYAHGIYGKRYR
jgi:cathepsin A (carboxypeptidase C)